jgi:nucleotide-binding universal stress UspA family protein
MTTKPIVAATDGSDESLRAVEWAAREATLRGAPLRIVAAAELPPRMRPSSDAGGPDTVADVLIQQRDHALEEAAKRAAALSPNLVIGTDSLSGPVAQAVTDAGSGALMLVVGSRGAGAFSAMILGSVSRYAATHSMSPVAVIRDEPTAAHAMIGVGIRDADSCEGALAFAFEEASLRDASLTAVHAWHGPATDGALEKAGGELAELLASWQDRYPGVRVTQEVVHGHPGRALADLSGRADLTVLGDHVPRGLSLRGPGTVTHSLLTHAQGPVITVPSMEEPA